ncbi:MAG: hypothetical protein RSE41_05040 [Clostridia bacterium]
MESKLYLFPENTKKIDLISNKGYITTLDDICIRGNIKPCLDSMCVLNLTIICEDDKQIYKSIGKKQILKVLIQGLHEYFIITDVVKDLDEIEITARQWTIDVTRGMFLEDVRPTNLNSIAYLEWCKTHSKEYLMGKQFAKDLEIGGNITDLKTNYFMNKNMYDAINEASQNFKGEIKREGFKVSIVDHVGSKTPTYEVEYGMNLLENTQHENFDIVIGVIGKGFDGIQSPIIYSGLLKDNPNLLGRTTELETKVRVRKEGEEEQEGYIYFNTENEAIAELTRLAREQFTIHQVDMPIIEYTTKFIDLSTTEEYKDAPQGFINVGDVVNVKIEKYNDLNVNVRVYSYTYNVLTQEIEDVTLTNNSIESITPPSMSSIVQEIEKKPNMNEVIEVARQESTALVNQGFGGYVHYDKSYVAIGDNEKVDLMKNCIVLNKNGIKFSKNGVFSKDSTLVMDINGNFNASVISTGKLNSNLIRTGNIVSADNKVNIGLDNGNINITGGALTVTNSNGTVVIDGKHNMHKIVLSGTLKLKMETGVTKKTAFVAHNLGYKPCSSAYVELQAEKTYVYPFPYISYNNFSSSTIGMTTLGRCWASDNLLEFVFIRTADTAVTEEVFSIRYYIYKEVAI